MAPWGGGGFVAGQALIPETHGPCVISGVQSVPGQAQEELFQGLGFRERTEDPLGALGLYS